MQWRNNRVDRVDNVQGPPSARGPRVPDKKNISLATHDFHVYPQAQLRELTELTVLDYYRVTVNVISL